MPLPPIATQTMTRRVVARLPRRLAWALASALGLLMLVSLAIPPLAMSLLLVLLAFGAFALVDYARLWLKHRPISRPRDRQGKPQPHFFEGVLLLWFALSGMTLWHASLAPFWLAVLITAVLFVLGHTFLHRWWIPYRTRDGERRSDNQRGGASLDPPTIATGTIKDNN